MADTVEQLYKDEELTEKLYPITKESAVKDENNVALNTKITNKMNKVSGATSGNLACFNATGEVVDSGYSAETVGTGKMSKPVSHTTDHIVTFDSNGDGKDSGYSVSDVYYARCA